jgi:hypothetical protein
MLSNWAALIPFLGEGQNLGDYVSRRSLWVEFKTNSFKAVVGV